MDGEMRKKWFAAARLTYYHQVHPVREHFFREPALLIYRAGVHLPRLARLYADVKC